MDETGFWQKIDEVRTLSGGTNPDSPSADPEVLKSVLVQAPDGEVADFCQIFYRLLCNLNSWELWAAGYILAGGMGDDSFHYFRSWIIGKGKHAYEMALRQPGELGSIVGEEADFDNELLEYIAVEILEGRGKEDPRDLVAPFADDAPQGEPFNEDTVGDLFPKLVAVSRRIGNWD